MSLNPAEKMAQVHLSLTTIQRDLTGFVDVLNALEDRFQDPRLGELAERLHSKSSWLTFGRPLSREATET